MQNVLTFPTTIQKIEKGKSALQIIKNFLKNCKIRRELAYKEKIDFLENECYKFYLKKILEQRHKAKLLDFPDFMYWERLTVCSEAVCLSRMAVAITEMRYGRKFIDKCYKARINKNKRV